MHWTKHQKNITLTQKTGPLKTELPLGIAFPVQFIGTKNYTAL